LIQVPFGPSSCECSTRRHLHHRLLVLTRTGLAASSHHYSPRGREGPTPSCGGSVLHSSPRRVQLTAEGPQRELLCCVVLCCVVLCCVVLCCVVLCCVVLCCVVLCCVVLCCVVLCCVVLCFAVMCSVPSFVRSHHCVLTVSCITMSGFSVLRDDKCGHSSDNNRARTVSQ
jgi:hypothetical protein